MIRRLIVSSAGLMLSFCPFVQAESWQIGADSPINITQKKGTGNISLQLGLAATTKVNWLRIAPNAEATDPDGVAPSGSPGRSIRGHIILSSATIHSDHPEHAEQWRKALNSDTYEHIHLIPHRIITEEKDGQQRTTLRCSITITGITREVDLAIKDPLPVWQQPLQPKQATSIAFSASIDTRWWNLDVTTGGFVQSNPIIALNGTLLCTPLTEEPPAPQRRRMVNITLSDHRNTLHQIDTITQAIILVGGFKQRHQGRRWRETIGKYVPDNAVFMIFDGRDVAVEKRQRLMQRMLRDIPEGVDLIIDWDGKVSQALRLPANRLSILALDANGLVTNEASDDITVEKIMKILRAHNALPDEPIILPRSWDN